MGELNSLISNNIQYGFYSQIQRAIMQELVQMVEFKFTIGINRLYKGIVRNQKNKKKGNPLKIEGDIAIEDLLTYCEGEI